MKRYIVLMVTFAILFSLCSCGRDQVINGKEQGGKVPDVAIVSYLEKMNKANYIQLTIGEQVASLNMDGNSYIELETLNCENDLTVSYIGHVDYSVTFADVPLTAGETISYHLSRLDKNDTIPVTVVDNANGESRTFRIATWPSFIPTYTVVGETIPYEGDYYLTTITPDGRDNIALKVGLDGVLKYYRRWPNTAVADFKKVNTPEGVRYLLFTTIDTRYDTKGVSHLGTYRVMDETYSEIMQLYMKKSDHVPADNYPVDQHDCLYISDNEYYLFSYVDKNVYNIPDNIEHKEYGSLVSAAVIQGIRNGEVFFEWDSTDYPELYELSVEYNDFTNLSGIYAADYMHINSIALDPADNNLIISCRNIDTIMKIDASTGDILWKLSGLGDDFGLTANQKTSRQHYAHYTDQGSITVFDNGNTNAQTRVVEYWLDENTHELKKFSEYKIDGYFSYATGSTQRLDKDSDVFLVGWGFRAVGSDGTNNLYPQFSVIDFSQGKTLFEFRFSDPTISTYRCVLCP
jgi:arylsulfate sulfotransferase